MIKLLRLQRFAPAGLVRELVLQDPHHVVARLIERNRFDPIDDVDLRVARVAVRGYPAKEARLADVVARNGEDRSRRARPRDPSCHSSAAPR